MDPEEHGAQRTIDDEEQWIEEGWGEKNAEKNQVKREKSATRITQEPNMLYFGPKNEADRSTFINGLSAGLGIGCIVTFAAMWVAVYFTPQLPAAATYEDLLSIFIFPLIYLLAIGLVTLTAGIVREYYTAKFNT